MTLPGPLHGDFYLAFDGALAARAEGGNARIRVIGSAGYPHDIRVGARAPGKLRAGRVFAPVIDPGHGLTLDLDTPQASAHFKILCANCFAEIWSRPLGPAPEAAAVARLEREFWDAPTQPGCPRCLAAAARAH